MTQTKKKKKESKPGGPCAVLRFALFDEKVLILRREIGSATFDHKSLGEQKVDMSVGASNSLPLIYYRGRYAQIEGGWQTLVHHAVQAIDAELDKEGGTPNDAG